LADNGGFSNSFAPLAEQATSLAVADLQAAVAAWNMETAVTEVMDLTVDQRGLTRAATTMAGSIDSAAEVSSAIENVTINTIQDGIYYTLQGQAMGKDFNVLPRGLYIRNGMKFVK
jgi:immune inhibitor A